MPFKSSITGTPTEAIYIVRTMLHAGVSAGIRSAVMYLRRRSYRWIVLAAPCAAFLLSACTAAVPVSLPANGIDDGAAAQARVAATVTAAQAAQARIQATATAGAAASQSAALTPTPATAANQQVVSVRRGTITQVAQFDGRVTAADETPLSFSTSGTIATVSVTVGQTVSEGQILVQTDSKAINQSIKDTQSRADSTAIQLQLSQGQAASRQQDAQTQVQAAIRAAQDNLAKVQAGASDAERQTADQAVVTAQAALDKAQSDLNRLTAPASSTEVRNLQQKIQADQLVLRTAQADKAKLLAGADDATLRGARQELANAQAGLSIAQSELDTLTRGPDQFELRAAQRDIDRAQAALTNAQSLKVASGSSPEPGSVSQSQKDIAVADAQLGLQAAQDNLAKLKQPPKPAVLTAAQNKLDNAKATVTAAQAKLDKLQLAPPQLDVDKADAAIANAQATLDNDQTQLTTLQKGPSNDQVQAANSAVSAAQIGLGIVQTRRDELNSHPTAAELARAQQQLADAQANASRLRTGQAADAGGANALQQKDLDQIHQQLDSLQAQLEATNLRAPFDGTVVSVNAHQGDNVNAGRTVVSLAHPGDPIVTITLPGLTGTVDSAVSQSAAASRVAQGQPSKLQIDGGDGTQLTGTVVSTSDDGQGGRTGTIKVDWAGNAPKFGATALVRVAVDAKQNALLVPASAVHAVGPVKYVDLVTGGGGHQTVNVQTGLTSDSDIEIVSGLSEGQQILGPQQASASPTASAAANSTRTSAGPSAASSATPSPSSAASSPTPLFDEHFDLNHAQWPSDPNSVAWIKDGAYYLEPRQAGRFVAVAAPLADQVRDVQVTATFQKMAGPSGGGYGLIVRDQDPSRLNGTNQDGSFYVVEVGDEGQIGIWQRDGGKWVDIMPWTNSDAVHSGNATNELTVRTVNKQLTFIVNGVEVAQRNDLTLESGGIGVFVGGDGNQVALQHLTVQSAQ